MSERFFRSTQEKNRHGARFMSGVRVREALDQDILGSTGVLKDTLAVRSEDDAGITRATVDVERVSDPILQRTGLESLSSLIVVVSPTNSL